MLSMKGEEHLEAPALIRGKKRRPEASAFQLFSFPFPEGRLWNPFN
jgi:hypothetical protein